MSPNWRYDRQTPGSEQLPCVESIWQCAPPHIVSFEHGCAQKVFPICQPDHGVTAIDAMVLVAV